MSEWWRKVAAELAAPFPPARVRWRVGSTNKAKTRGMVLAYIDSRDVQDRLDQVVHPQNWRAHIEHQGPVAVCTLEIWCPDRSIWIAKSDGAGATAFEGDKGRISDAFKRSAVHWGVGRYLYGLDSPWVDVEQRGKTAYMKPGEQQKLTRHLEKVTAQLIRDGYAPAPEGAAENAPEEEISEPEDAGDQSEPKVALPPNPVSTDEAKRLLAAARDVGKTVGEHGLTVMRQVLKTLELPLCEKQTVTAYLEHLTTHIAEGDTHAIREELMSIEKEGF